MKACWVTVFVVLVTTSSVTSYSVTVRADFGCTLRTGNVDVFSRRQYVNGHGTFKPDTDVVPQRMLDYLTTVLQVSFSRSTKGPFKEGTFPTRAARFLVEEDGKRDLNNKQCKRCNTYQLRFLSEKRVVADDPFMIPRITRNKSMREKAVSYAGNFFRYFFDDQYVLPSYYECFNEPMGKASRLKKAHESHDDFVARITELCTELCEELEGYSKKVLTGGPAAAFVRPSFKDFALFKKRMKIWLDGAAKKRCQKFISEHVYNIGGSYAEANLDLIETYSSWLSENGKPQPYLVSEMGQYISNWYSRARREAAPPLSSRDFSIMNEALKVLMMLMRIPNNVLQVITFINMETQEQRDIDNGNHYPWSLINEKRNGNVEFTNLVKYFELLKGLDGEFIYTSSNNVQVSVNAVSTRFKGYIIMQNLIDSEATVNLLFPHGRDPLKWFERRRLRINKKPLSPQERAQSILVGGDLWWTVSRQEKKGDRIFLPSQVVLFPYETTVFEVAFDKPSRERRKVNRSRHYASYVRDHNNNKPDFPAPIEKNKKVHYYFENLPNTPGGVVAIRISHSRAYGSEDKPSVFVNDVRVPPESFSAEVAGGYKKFDDGKYYGVFIFHYNLEDIVKRQFPKVSVSYPDSGGWSVSVVLEIDQCSNSSCCVLGNRKNRKPCPANIDAGKLRPHPTPIPRP
ncbi:hypothetical protein NDN08_002097 [Rhodosorus marinus]|uniref:Uncharacterized protein n=1 Tax=Rhodosorus marinus TaxID=101924 RepID=A0AAV8USQ6_9RHOD|nr:hypothetical protein NDN08_002097 [Rhodosorus marinus]